jgi:hypothetical protein
MKKECTICFEEGVDFVALPCQHEVCPSCRTRLVQLNNRCPYCQASLQPPLYVVERYENASDEIRRYDQFVLSMMVVLVIFIICCIILVSMRNPRF